MTRTTPSQDEELCRRLRALGYDVSVAPNGMCVWNGPGRWWYVCPAGWCGSPSGVTVQDPEGRLLSCYKNLTIDEIVNLVQAKVPVPSRQEAP